MGGPEGQAFAQWLGAQGAAGVLSQDTTYDIAVDFKPGHYYFQCDPHALLGMIGRLEVEERDH